MNRSSCFERFCISFPGLSCFVYFGSFVLEFWSCLHVFSLMFSYMYLLWSCFHLCSMTLPFDCLNLLSLMWLTWSRLRFFWCKCFDFFFAFAWPVAIILITFAICLWSWLYFFLPLLLSFWFSAVPHYLFLRFPPFRVFVQSNMRWQRMVLIVGSYVPVAFTDEI